MFCFSVITMRVSFLFVLFLFPVLFFCIEGHTNTGYPFGSPLPMPQNPPDYSTTWTDSVFNSLTLEERIAQLLMVRVETDRSRDYYVDIVQQVSDYNLGGVAFFRGGPKTQLMLTNRLQSQVKTPLLVGMDAEWGPSMRLDSLMSFPRQKALGAIRNDQLIYQMGLEIGRQLRRLGVHINFAPVVDVNNNPDNPVINFRAFGETPDNVAGKGLAYMHGLQDAGIIACAKHFPGHGDTNADSHRTLPRLNHSVDKIEKVHLYPFKKMIDQGLHAVMTAHLEIPSLEPQEQLAATLSYNIVTDLLQKKMGFQGLVITDALSMNGVSDFFEPGELELLALAAGNDILLLPEDVPKAISTIKKAVQDGTIPESRVNQAVKKVLYYKEKAGLDDFRYIPPDNLVDDINSPQSKKLNKTLVESSLTLVQNTGDMIPVRELRNKRIAALSIGDHPGNTFHSRLADYAPVSQYGIDKHHTTQRAFQVISDLKPYDMIIISVHDNSLFPTNDYGINGKTIGLINAIASQQDVVVTLFANPYSLAFFEDDILKANSILVAYQEGDLFEDAAAQAIFGGIQTSGSLPVTAGSHFPVNTGVISKNPTRIHHGMPEEAGIHSRMFDQVDSIAIDGIRKEAYPGCQIAIVKNGSMIYHKSFGYHTYDSINPVRSSDIYDVASVTKVAATTAAVMHLHDEGILELDKELGFYLPWLADSDKADITLREIMTHQGRLTPWIPFYRATLNKGDYMAGLYYTEQSPDYPLQVANGLYINKHYRDTILTAIAESDLLSESVYQYSDLGFILLAEIVEEITGENLDQFVNHFLYEPLGLQNTAFLPLKTFASERLIPSENDTIWRRQVIKGHVHDPTAAMLGGVSGHAGLFSNAADLAVLMQLFLNEGHYGGEEYFLPRTVKAFTHVQYQDNGNRRGLGFDKPSLEPDSLRNTARSASPMSFGHSGFTGSYVWADPAENLVYVFLSNRTYPDQSNRKIIEENIRTEILQTIYEAIYHSKILQQYIGSAN